MAERLSFRIAEVEGPLDLILQLISRHKLNIYDIEITKLLEQYMAYVQEAQRQNLELASEFLEMASRLVYIKSVSLLPKHEELEQQLRKELTGQLIEYTLCRQVAELLEQRFVGDDIFYRPMQVIEKDPSYRRVHQPDILLQSYLSAVGKKKLPQDGKKFFEPIMAKRVVSVQSKIVALLKRLYQEQSIAFLSLFDQSRDRSDIVATFLAVLELVKSRRAILEDDGKTVHLA